MILWLCKYPSYKEKILEEIEKEIKQPSKVLNSEDWEILDYLNFDNLNELNFYANCFNEALRLQPPVYFSSMVMMNQDVEAAGLKIRKGDPITIGMSHICRDAN